MSHILDALKKVQDEKTAHLKQSTVTGGALLVEQQTRPARKRKLLIGTSVCVAGIAAVLLFLFRTPTTPPTPAPIARQPLQQPMVVPAPQPPPPPSPPQAPPQTVKPAPAPPLSPAKSPHLLVQADTQQQPAKPQKPSKNRGLQQQGGHVHPQTTPVEPSRIRAIEPEGIKLAGIAWQDNRANRRAVVNDQLVGEGSVVNGVKVLEIRQTLVRFEKGGVIYEATLPR